MDPISKRISIRSLTIVRREFVHCWTSSRRPSPLRTRFWDYGGGLVGYGHYHYRYASGRTGEYFMIGIGNRKRYIAIYANAADGDRYLVETFQRSPARVQNWQELYRGAGSRFDFR